MSEKLWNFSIVALCICSGFGAQAQEASLHSEPAAKRNFGVSLGGGIESVIGNRGYLWQSSNPSFDLKMAYWFDFPLSIEAGYSKASYYYHTNLDGIGHVDVSMDYLYVDSKYKVGPAWMPSLILGFGEAFKAETNQNLRTTDHDHGFMMNVGLSMEIPLAQRISVVPEWRYRIARFNDTSTTTFLPMGLPDLGGGFQSFTLSLLSSW